MKKELILTGEILTHRADPKFEYIEIKEGLLYYSLTTKNLLITRPKAPADDDTEYLSFGDDREYEIIGCVEIETERESIEVQIASANDTARECTEDIGNWETIATGDSYKDALENTLEEANNESFEISNSWLRIKTKTEIINL